MAVKLVLFDLDGTLYIGDRLFPGAKRALRKLHGAGIDYAFMTNNSSISPSDYLLKLKNFGVNTDIKNIITSSEATCLMLDNMQLGSDIFIFGTKSFREYLRSHGYQHTETNPGAVLVGFDLELTYEKLIKATRFVANGVPLVSSHPDAVCPSPDGPIPDAGMLLAAIKAGTGVKPKAIAGKPYRWIVKVAQQHFDVKLSEIVIVGDRLETDIRMGQKYRMKTVLVLSGVTKASEVKKSRFKPDIVIPSVAQIADNNWLDKLS